MAVAQDDGWKPLELLFGDILDKPLDPPPKPKKPKTKVVEEKSPTPASLLDQSRIDYLSVPAPDPRQLLPRQLTDRELEYARTAWNYFDQNTHPVTGLVPSVRNFKSMTLWDEGGYLLALTSAYKLGLISRIEAANRLSLAFSSLAQLPLFNGVVPNKAYNIETLEMTDYANKPKPEGIGYSALDIMRLMSGILAATHIFPEFTPMAQLIVDRWNLSALADKGRFMGMAILHKSYKKRVQEGRIGYEQYAGVTGQILGLPVDLAAQFDPILRWQQYFTIRVPGDKRTAHTHGVSAVTTSEPFLLEVLEYGWRPQTYQVAGAVFQAQLMRHHQTGFLTSLSEDHIKGPPYFAYNAILVDYEPFQSVTASRKNVSDKRGFSTKGAFGWWAITDHPYAHALLEQVQDLQTEFGWMAGRFEADGSANEILTLNTNAVILEALHYRAFGPLYPIGS